MGATPNWSTEDGGAGLNLAKFSVLAHRFACTWDWPEAGLVVRMVLREFEVESAQPGHTSTYEFVDLGESVDFRYRLRHEDEELWSANHTGEVLDHFFWHVNREAFARTEHALVVHAGVVALPGGPAILLPAASGSGKTTLVTALIAHGGFEYLSDEAAPIEPATLEVAPFPKALAVKGSLEAIMPDLVAARGVPSGTGHWHLDPAAIPATVAATPAPIGAVVFPTYAKHATFELSAMARAESLSRLLGQVLNPSAWRAGGLFILAELAGRTTHHRLVYGDLRGAVDALSELARRAK